MTDLLCENRRDHARHKQLISAHYLRYRLLLTHATIWHWFYECHYLALVLLVSLAAELLGIFEGQFKFAHLLVCVFESQFKILDCVFISTNATGDALRRVRPPK
jgi:hypothetical protein